jgi:hypothetical protein
MRTVTRIIGAAALSLSTLLSVRAEINPATVNAVIEALASEAGTQKAMMERGVRQVARLWQAKDGNDEAFKTFCVKNYIADPAGKEAAFMRISEYMESIGGGFWAMNLKLNWYTTINDGPVTPIDRQFSAYSPSSHISEDFYNNKIAFTIALNFPEYTLAEKEQLADRRQWAYARLGDYYTQRIPSEVSLKRSETSNDIDMYVADYNIYMGRLLDQKGKKLFPENQVLLQHWNLRDEIKANYSKGKEGIDRQRTVQKVMERIIAQEIPVEVINSGRYDWNPFTNKIYDGNKETAFTPETSVRYQKLLNSFHGMQDVDKYTGNTFVERSFNNNMEMALDDVVALFDTYLSAPELKEIGKLISKRTGRKLEAFDIWYDGFKERSNLDETKLDAQTRALYPDAKAMEKDLPNILVKLGFSRERADYLASRIAVDNARGSGHAMGAGMKGQKARLRTRIPEGGMDYKGYNIAIHEFGHNVEQTISLYDVDYYMLNGVPNTAFTEALAFVFQKRDLDILGIKDNNPEKEKMEVLDKAWTMYEISGVSMVDIAVWQWMYAHPEATATELRDAVVQIAKDVWNKYFAPVFGIKDQTILAVYQHMVSYPLYLSNYAIGQIIEFQLDRYFEGKNLATEVDRIYRLGRLTPKAWMKQATGDAIAAEPLLDAIRRVL